jgi:hypothetical protein
MNYQNGKIYQILNYIDNEIYIGSTCQPLSKRFHQHKQDSKKDNLQLYKHMEELGNENFYIELIENYPCNTKEELRAREGYFIRERATLNKRIEGRTSKDYYSDNKELILQKMRNYYNENKDKIKQKAKDYHNDNKEKKKEYYNNNKEYILNRKKDYDEQNKEMIKEYYQKNKERLLEKHNCECGGSYTTTHKSRHMKSKTHQSFFNSK